MHKHNHSYGDEGCACCNLEANYKREDSKKLDKETIRDIIFLCVSLLFLIAGFFDWHNISGGNWPLLFLYYVNPAWISVILCGTPIFKKGIKTILKGKTNASVLISIAMLASIALEIAGLCGVDVTSSSAHNHSYIFAAGEIAFLMGLGEMLEDLTVKKCRSGIQRLVSLIPKEANVKEENGEIVRKKTEEVNAGDIVITKTGEMVAVDGIIVKGEGSVDESSLTGEYLPRDVSEGDSVFGGSVNLSGVIEIRTEKTDKNMTIARMADLTIEAEGKKAPISKTADKAAQIIVPCVFVTSIIVGIIAYFALHAPLMESIVRAATILVVFCPCALVLATPTAVAAGLGNAARNGVLIKSGASLEELSRTDTVCFDKTGTLTEGKIRLEKALARGCSEKELIKTVASVERFSDHPIAKAVVKEADGEFYDAENIKSLQGAGIMAEISGSEVLVLSFRKAEENGLKTDDLKETAEEELGKGNTVVIAVEDGVILGLLSFSDTIKENAKEAVENLLSSGYRTVMLTGDNEKAAANIASVCGVKEVRSGLLPEDKLSEIEKLQSEGHKVVMVGDGVNDAPSLKMANCSFAMGAMGTDIAVDTADMAILNSDLNKVNDTIRLSKRVMNAIKRNITIAMCINAVAIVCTLLGWLNPATGALVHNCTSVLVVASSALLLYNRKKKK